MPRGLQFSCSGTRRAVQRARFCESSTSSRPGDAYFTINNTVYAIRSITTVNTQSTSQSSYKYLNTQLFRLAHRIPNTQWVANTQLTNTMRIPFGDWTTHTYVSGIFHIYTVGVISKAG